MKYRADVDGLRAIAVIPVLLFHAGIPGFHGGYIGVDIFFVISGFLITGIIHEEIINKNFSISYFYERRIRRILPALFFTIFSCIIAGYILLTPDDYVDFFKSAFAATLSASNILFWHQAGYFDGAATSKPLLHTWSLAVEEQFYIIFPIILLFSMKFSKKYLKILIILLILISFSLSVLSIFYSKISGFYLLPMRAWELLIGSYLAIYFKDGSKLSLFSNNALAILGMSAIFLAIVFFDEQTPFPGYAALIPSLGAAALIYTGHPKKTLVCTLLSQKYFVGIGRISYSLYLWHWPILVYFEYYNIDRLSLVQRAFAILIAFFAAYLSWRFVEQPFRSRRLAADQKWVFITAGGLAAIFVAISLTAIRLDGLPSRFSTAAQSAFAASQSFSNRLEMCSGKLALQFTPQSPCMIGDGKMPIAFIWGDSHADALTEAFETVNRETGISFYYSIDASCPPILGVGTDKACLAAGQKRIEFLRQHPEIQYVILAARWTSYVRGRAVDFGPAESNEQLPELIDENGNTLPKLSENTEEYYLSRLRETILDIIKQNKKVAIVYPIPETGYNIPSTIARKIEKGEDPETFVRPRDYYNNRHERIIKLFNELSKNENIIQIRPDDVLCEQETCFVYRDGHPLYYDDDHLSREGARYIAPQIARALIGTRHNEQRR